ncbi:DnaA regulatory inactivator Hda [Monaibacterium marinum]|uniref:DnaA regulatory inactivator Hda n=1 Tax=Pontivivens marinum TaxID=1690039 RepID=A0A2C9CMM9_9RHOB|nr:DnaA/Hda family protein [Monaibacterium marinum]SOH92445.1 DnaA regulatory inactivator Hda [Monaibacterium marinum]
MSQIPLDLPHRAALDREAFFVSASNAEALAMVEAWHDWPAGKLALTGAGGSGKTHLAHVWAAGTGGVVVNAVDLTDADLPGMVDAGAVAVEDVDHLAAMANPRPAEAALFHLHNMLAGAGGKLLVTGKNAPSRWRLTTPDLASRLQAAGIATLGAPDDALIHAVIVKIATDRQLDLDPRLPPFLALRLDRSLASIADALAELDRQALAEQRRVTVPFARQVLSL